jgi:hypothetical protein
MIYIEKNAKIFGKKNKKEFKMKEQLGDFINSAVIGKVFAFDGDRISFTKSSVILYTKNRETYTFPYITEGNEDTRS